MRYLNSVSIPNWCWSLDSELTRIKVQPDWHSTWNDKEPCSHGIPRQLVRLTQIDMQNSDDIPEILSTCSVRGPDIDLQRVANTITSNHVVSHCNSCGLLYIQQHRWFWNKYSASWGVLLYRYHPGAAHSVSFIGIIDHRRAFHFFYFS